MSHINRFVPLVRITTVPFSLGFIHGQPALLRSLGFCVHVITSPGDRLDQFAVEETVIPHAIPMQRRITPLRDIVALFRIYRTLCKVRPSIVHTHSPKAGLLGSLAAWLARVPVRIHTVHGLPMMTASGMKRRILRWCEKITCRCACQVLAVSNSLRKVVVHEGICPTAKIKVLLSGSSRGVDALGQFHPGRWSDTSRRDIRQKLGIPPDALVLGFVGRVVRDKGMDELAAAWQTLLQQFPTLHLLVVGPLESEDPVPADVLALFQSDPRIHLVGETRDTSPLFAAMDVFTLPSYREGLPVVLLEASAMELAIVATQIPGCVDAVVDGVTGTLVPQRNAQALADAIAAYLRDPDLRRKHGLAGRQRVLAEFRQEAIWQAIYDEYARLMCERGLSLPEPLSETSTAMETPQRRAA